MSEPSENGPIILHVRPGDHAFCVIDGSGHEFYDLEGNAFELTPKQAADQRQSRETIRGALERVRDRFGRDEAELKAAGYEGGPDEFSQQIESLLELSDEQLPQNLNQALSTDNGDGGAEGHCSRLARLLGLCR